MAKAVLLSIRPKWVEKIVDGRKTVEIRKSHPKIATPFKCYIYCTKPKYEYEDYILTDWPKPQNFGGGKVVGEFVCDKIETLVQVGYTGISGSLGYKIRSPQWEVKDPERLFEAACLNEKEVNDYLNGHIGYGWHISKLQIYDKPRELGEFMKISRDCRYADVAYLGPKCECCSDGDCMMKRPPQSWCYVMEVSAV